MTLASSFRCAILSAVVCAGFSVAQEKPAESKPPSTQESKPVDIKPESPGEVKVDPSTPPAAVDPKTYIIGIQDVVGITVWREPELSRFYTVRPDGRISMPLAGDIAADGITPEQLKERVTTALGVYMTRPEVIIDI